MIRNCNGCTVCCVETSIIEKDFQKDRFIPCMHLCNGCNIYNDRPKTCKEYDCLWLKGIGNDSDRPDKSGLILDLQIYNNKHYIVAREFTKDAYQNNGAFLTDLPYPVLLVKYNPQLKVVLPTHKVERNGSLSEFESPPIIRNWDFPEIDEKLKDTVLYNWEIAIALLKLGEKDSAREYLEEAVKLLPEFKPGIDVLDVINM